MSGRLCCISGIILLSVVGSLAPVQAQAMRITSITFSAPSPLKAGDVITVDLAGTPGVRAAVSVKNLIPTTHLQEISTGSYRGVVTVPSGKFVRNSPLVGYLGNDEAHAAPVQASRLITVAESTAEQPTKLPVIQPEPRPQPANPPTPTAPTLAPPAPPAPKPALLPAPAARNTDKVVLTSPANGAMLRRSIIVKGKARPEETVRVTITYNNGLTGMLKLAGEVASQNLAAGKNGQFSMGPIALDGPLATDGLRFTIKAYYPDRADHGTDEVVVIGKRE